MREGRGAFLGQRFSINPDDIADTRVDMTLFAGEVVHQQ